MKLENPINERAASRRIELSAGPIHYQEVGASAAPGAPTIVFVHGALVDASLWQQAAGKLAATHRCIVPTWPLGSHREAMKPHADLSPGGVARLIVEFLDALDLEQVTLVANDSGGAICQCLLALGGETTHRVSRWC